MPPKPKFTKEEIAAAALALVVIFNLSNIEEFRCDFFVYSFPSFRVFDFIAVFIRQCFIRIGVYLWCEILILLFLLHQIMYI